MNAMVLVAQGADPAGLHDQGRLGEGLADPADGEGAQDVAVAHDEHIARDARLLGLPDDVGVVVGADLGDQAVDARDDVLGRLATRAPVAPDVPAAQALSLAHLADLGGRDALVVAVVPLGDARVDRHARVSRVLRRLVGIALGRRVRAATPREWLVAAQVEEFEGSFGSLSRRHVAVDFTSGMRSALSSWCTFARNLRCLCVPAGARGAGPWESRDIHVYQLPGHDQPVVAHQCPPRCPHSLLAVLRQRDVRRARVFA